MAAGDRADTIDERMGDITRTLEKTAWIVLVAGTALAAATYRPDASLWSISVSRPTPLAMAAPRRILRALLSGPAHAPASQRLELR